MTDFSITGVFSIIRAVYVARVLLGVTFIWGKIVLTQIARS